MTGSLQQKNGKYYIVLSFQDDRKWKTKWVATGLDVKGNKRKAEELLRATLLDPPQKDVSECDIYFHEYIEVWLQRAKQRVNIVTYEGYETEVRRYVLPYFKDHPMKLTDLNRRKMQNFFDYLIKTGRKDGRGPLSPKTLRDIKNVVYQPLKEAVKDELIVSNPCEFVELPKPVRFEASYYNAKQMRDLFDAIKGDVLEPMIKITALYGLRRSEILGIKWDSIDFETGHLTIKHTVVVVKTLVEKPTITKEQVYNKLIMLAFNEAYDMIERSAKKGNQAHVLTSFSRFDISEDYYHAMIDKQCELYHTEIDTEYSTQCFLAPPQIYVVREKNGFIGSKSTVSYTTGGIRFITDLQTKFKAEGIVLQFIPYIRTTNGDKQVPVGVAFQTPPCYGGLLNVDYRIHYDPI